MMVRTVAVGMLFLVALGLLGYLFVLHPEGPRLLAKVGPEPAKPGAAAPANPPPRPAVSEEQVTRPDSPTDLPSPDRVARPRQGQPPAPSPPPRVQPPAPGRLAIPEERIRPPLMRTEESPPAGATATLPARADGMGTLSAEDIERIVEKRKAIQLRLGGS